MAAFAAAVAGSLIGRTHAQGQAPAAPATLPPVVAPQIPQPSFRAPEDVFKTGVPASEIKAGVIPNYRGLRDKLVVIPVNGNIWLIGGAGSNVAMQVSDEGVLLVDDGDERAADKVIDVVRQYAPRNLRWIINTSADLDHNGANIKVAKAGAGGGNQAFNGAGAGIMAHENVLNRMSAPTGQQAARETDSWPTDTFFTKQKNMWYGGEPIELHYLAAAHTDGDIAVFFRKSDVIVAGEVLAADSYPRISADKGGSIQGILDALNWMVGTAIPQYNQQGGTRIIPGHGRVYNQTDVVEYRDMATIIRDRVAQAVKKGMNLDQIKALHPCLDYEGQYGKNPDWTTDMFLAELYKEATAKPAPAPVTAKKPAAPVKKS
jgi:glyoxylase-like metal-dependent hydrolase (beta-lactamase superfamily II)